MLTTALTTLLGIERPVLLAPMGDVAGGALAAAVSNAGGLGMVGAGYADVDWLRRELALAQEARVGVGFITFALEERPSALDLALERRPPVVQLSFGDPTPYIPTIKDAGAKVICQVQTVADARRAASAGADAVIAQGQDSGGHGSPGRGTFGLLPAVVDAVAPVPVVAAGGIGDGRGLAAALLLGASAVSIGTRLFASQEALADDAEARLLVESGGDDTVRSPVFDVVRGPAWPPGFDARALRNDLTDWWDQDQREPDSVEAMRVAYLRTAADDHSMRPVWAGEGVDQVRSILPAAEIVRDICLHAERLLRTSHDFIDSDG